MFFNKNKNKTEELEEKPLGYWEEESYMLVIPESPDRELIESISERVSNIEGVKIIKENKLTDNEPGRININYENEEYEVGYYPSKFNLPEMYINNKYYFKKEELDKLRNAETALTVFMKFNRNSKKSYHLQLKLVLAMIPNLIGVMDESAEKMIPAAWVKMTANTSFN